MRRQIKTYPVLHPQLKRHIKFFWEFDAAEMRLDHRLVPQRNINVRFNLSETPQYGYVNGEMRPLPAVSFAGLHDRATDTRLRLSGRAHVLGICFLPDGFYPFLKMPVVECKNQLLGASEAGFKSAHRIHERLNAAKDIGARLNILEAELALLFDDAITVPPNFRLLFERLRHSGNPLQLADFCRRNSLSPRRLERMYDRYVGLSATAYNTLNRFHLSLNQLLRRDYARLSDIAYDNGYFDQAHFIKKFKRFTGSAPRSFMSRQDSILHIGHLT